MTTQQHPITSPPEELLDKWEGEWHHYQGQYTYEMFMAEQAAQWGADQELQACCLLLDSGEHAATYGCYDGTSLRAARRPKPPSLKVQALAALTVIEDKALGPSTEEILIRRALEQLND